MKLCDASVLIAGLLLIGHSDALLMKKMMKGAIMMNSMMKPDMSVMSMPMPWPVMMPEPCDTPVGMEMMAVKPPMPPPRMPVMVEEWPQMPMPVAVMMNMKPAAMKPDSMAMMKVMARMKTAAGMAHDMADAKMKMHMEDMMHGKTPCAEESHVEMPVPVPVMRVAVTRFPMNNAVMMPVPSMAMSTSALTNQMMQRMINSNTMMSGGAADKRRA